MKNRKARCASVVVAVVIVVLIVVNWISRHTPFTTKRGWPLVYAWWTDARLDDVRMDALTYSWWRLGVNVLFAVVVATAAGLVAYKLARKREHRQANA